MFIKIDREMKKVFKLKNVLITIVVIVMLFIVFGINIPFIENNVPENNSGVNSLGLYIAIETFLLITLLVERVTKREIKAWQDIRQEQQKILKKSRENN